jgi:hypothetical protein
MLSSITLKVLWQIVNYKVPIWFALIGVVVAVYALNRPIPQRIETEIVYRDYWRPPNVTQVIPPSKIIQYEPVPITQIRVDTVYVPIDMRTYQLWQPEKVHRRSNSIVVRSFNPSDISYRDYEYKPLERKFGGSIEMYGLYPHRIGLDASVYRGRFGLFARIEHGSDLYYGAGIKYRLY